MLLRKTRHLYSRTHHDKEGTFFGFVRLMTDLRALEAGQGAVIVGNAVVHHAAKHNSIARLQTRLVGEGHFLHLGLAKRTDACTSV